MKNTTYNVESGCQLEAVLEQLNATENVQTKAGT